VRSIWGGPGAVCGEQRQGAAHAAEPVRAVGAGRHGQPEARLQHAAGAARGAQAAQHQPAGVQLDASRRLRGQVGVARVRACAPPEACHSRHGQRFLPNPT